MEPTLGQSVGTHAKKYLRKGQTVRTGVVMGFCNDQDYVRVSWDGWRRTSTMQVDKALLFPAGYQNPD